ncbi:MAG: outer membrane beta-barrel protein [Alphaproteobacteria bacterium]
MLKNYIAVALALAASLSARQAFADAPPSLMPGMAGPLAANAAPWSFDAGEFGKIYVTGAVSGLGLSQSHPAAVNDHSTGDWSNAQIFMQKPEGIVQFFVQGGVYSIPSLGTPYMRAEDITEKTYNYLPQVFLKIAPTANFSVMAGKLPTLLGAEYTFTFENLNIERGLLWNQTNAVTRGVQANYTSGPLSFALSWNDGYYSNRYNWLTGSAAWTINAQNTLTFIGGGNLGHTAHADFATPLAQNNGELFDIIYTWTSGPWMLSPGLQYNHVGEDTGIGIVGDSSAFGAAVLGKFAFNENWSLAGRIEYIGSSGDAAGPNILYGQGSNAWSATLTPTYQYKTFFSRAEASYVRADDITAGSAFGSAGNDRSQTRLVFEAGSIF